MGKSELAQSGVIINGQRGNLCWPIEYMPVSFAKYEKTVNMYTYVDLVDSKLSKNSVKNFTKAKWDNLN